jgi:hypothetical protein
VNYCTCSYLVYEADYIVTLNAADDNVIDFISVNFLVVNNSNFTSTGELRIPLVTTVTYNRTNTTVKKYYDNILDIQRIFKPRLLNRFLYLNSKWNIVNYYWSINIKIKNNNLIIFICTAT